MRQPARRLLAAALPAALLVCPIEAAVRRPHPDHDLLSSGVVYRLSGMDETLVDTSRVWKKDGGVELRVRLYRPAGASPATPLPTVIFINGVGDPPGAVESQDAAGPRRVGTWGQYTSWPRLVAAAGFAGLFFDTRGPDPLPDVREGLSWVRAHARELGIDPDRIALWACSANVRAAITVAMEPGLPLRSAVFYYGMGSAPAIRADLPILLVRAGKDNPRLNEAILREHGRAVAEGAPWTLLNAPASHHAFDCLDETEESRQAIRQTLDFLARTLREDPAPQRPPSARRRALAFWFSGEHAAAATAYRELVRQDPDDAIAWTRLGLAELAMKNSEAAREALTRATQLEPGGGEAWRGLGDLDFEDRRFEAASVSYEKALRLDPGDAQALHKLGSIDLQAGAHARAVARLEEASRLQPGNGFIKNSLAHAYIRAGQPARAASLFEAVLQHAPDAQGVHYNLACARALAGMKELALEALERAVEKGLDDPRQIESDPDLESLRQEPRYLQLLARLRKEP